MLSILISISTISNFGIFIYCRSLCSFMLSVQSFFILRCFVERRHETLRLPLGLGCMLMVLSVWAELKNVMKGGGLRLGSDCCQVTI